MQVLPPPNDLYSSAVPVLSHYLHQLELMLEKAARQVAGKALDEQALLGARLAPAMFTLAQQVQTAAGFAQRACAPLVGMQPPRLGEGDAPDLVELQRRVALAQAFVNGLDAEEINAAAGERIRTQAGEAWLDFEAGEFLRLYALPNFFFHLAMAYALMRQAGVQLGKPDFDGWHRYAPGFSF